MILGIIGTIFSFIGIFGLFGCSISKSINEQLPKIFGGTTMIGVTLILIGAITDSYNKKPTTIDVYQSKITLQITYEDSIPVDTVVVFKSEFKKAMEE